MLVGRCVSYGEGATFLPLTEMIGREVLDAGSTGEIFLAARRRFEELAAERPLLLVFEDVHWAEPTLLDFVDYLAAQATGAPILALCLARPDLIAERGGWEASLTLEPLTDDEARELAGDEPHADRIAEIAEGNPLYVQQLAAYVGEEGAGRARLGSRLDRGAAREPPRPSGSGGARGGAARGGGRPTVLARRPSRRSGRSTRSRRSNGRASSAGRGRSTASTTCSSATSSTPGRRRPSAPSSTGSTPTGSRHSRTARTSWSATTSSRRRATSTSWARPGSR